VLSVVLGERCLDPQLLAGAVEELLQLFSPYACRLLLHASVSVCSIRRFAINHFCLFFDGQQTFLGKCGTIELIVGTMPFVYSKPDTRKTRDSMKDMTEFALLEFQKI
jgi:hypothetical protein